MILSNISRQAAEAPRAKEFGQACLNERTFPLPRPCSARLPHQPRSPQSRPPLLAPVPRRGRDRPLRRLGDGDHYARIGTAGRSRCYAVRDEGEAQHLARSILQRRAGAPRRIGVAYRIRELIDPQGWAGVLGDNPASAAKSREAAEPPRGREWASIGVGWGLGAAGRLQAAKGQ